MAPPIPFTILPGIIQLARSPQRDTLNQFLDSEEVMKCPQRRKMSSHLHCSQDGKANMATPDHGKTLLAREERAAGDGCHCLLARVDQVGVNLWIARLIIEFYNPSDFPRQNKPQNFTWSGVGKGPRPRIPFSDCRWTVIVGGMKLDANIGIPIPRLAYLSHFSNYPL